MLRHALHITKKDFCDEKDSCKKSYRYGLANARMTIFDCLTMKDIPTHYHYLSLKVSVELLGSK